MDITHGVLSILLHQIFHFFQAKGPCLVGLWFYFQVTEKYPRTNQMTFIEGGTFTMGSDDPLIPQDGEGPARTVTLDSFYLDVHEVSNAEFQLFVDDTKFVTEVTILKACSRS